jgi:hypothetical protein
LENGQHERWREAKMKYSSEIFMVFIMVIPLLLSSCSSQAVLRLKEENQFLRGESSILYRENFELTKYPKMSKFEKAGYDWCWTHLWESSGMITEDEEKRIGKQYGNEALKQWEKGHNAAWEIFAIGGDRIVKSWRQCREIEKKIVEIELKFLPKAGTSKKEVEDFWGQGKVKNRRLTGDNEDNHELDVIYELGENITLFICYKNGKVTSAHYHHIYNPSSFPFKRIPVLQKLDKMKKNLTYIKKIYEKYQKRENFQPINPADASTRR